MYALLVFDTADLKDAKALLDELNQLLFKCRFIDCDREMSGDWAAAGKRRALSASARRV